MLQSRMLIFVLAGLLAIGSAQITEKNIGCTGFSWTLQCDGGKSEYVIIDSIDPDENCLSKPACSEAILSKAYISLKSRCSEGNLCLVTAADFENSDCIAKIFYECVQGERTPPRVVQTTAEPEGAWKSDFGSWQWIIIFIFIAIVVVTLLILIFMLLNRCCISKFHQQPKFSATTPTGTHLGGLIYQTSVNMDTVGTTTTMKRPQPKLEEEVEVKAQFGTNNKKKDNTKYFTGTTLDSRGSGDGEPASKFYHGDDSSSGIGSEHIEVRMKNAMYDDNDTCHDDYTLYTMKKQYKSPVVNPAGYNTLQSAKKVDGTLYKQEGLVPQVDILEDQREEDFRLNIDKWGLNSHISENKEAQDIMVKTNVSVRVETNQGEQDEEEN